MQVTGLRFTSFLTSICVGFHTRLSDSVAHTSTAHHLVTDQGHGRLSRFSHGQRVLYAVDVAG